MVWAAPALAAATLCLRVSTDLVKATAAVLIVGAVLSSAEHPRDPSSRGSQALHGLGPNKSTPPWVAEAAREDCRRSSAAASLRQGPSQREKSPLLPRAPRRLPRSAERCPQEPITASTIEDTVPYLTPDKLKLCLSSDVLVENLEAVLDQPLTPQALRVLKQKVDEYFPSGIPEEQLRRLGVLSRLYTAQEISQWPVTTSATLSALLDSSEGQWNDSQMQQLLSRYLALGGSLSGPLLQEIGDERLCRLQEEQIQQISAGAIGTAGQLNISACSQTKKEQLYGKAREAFASLASSPGPYYCQIRPYLGGAPAKDLKDLANAGVAINMDLDTFLALNPQELQKLSVADVKHLLGKNLPELKKAEQEPSVVSWVQKQSQRELDCVLGIGLQGGLPEPTGTASPAGPTSPASATSRDTVPTPVPTSPASATSLLTVPTPVPTTPASATSLLTVPTPVPTTPASATSLLTVPISPHPATSANVTPMSPTLLPIPSTSASVTSMGTVPTPTAISSHSTPQPSTVPSQTPTPNTLSPAPPNTPPPTGGPPVPPVPTATPSVPPARPALSTPAPCSTHQAPTTDRATSPAVTLLSTLLATSSPSATPGPAVTSRATTGTNLAGTTHSTATPVPNPSSVPTATPVPNPSSVPTATPVPNPSPSPTATPVPNPSPSPTATPVPNPSSVPTATPVPNPSSVPTATPVPNPSSSPTATPVPHSPSVPAATTAPHTPTPIPNSTISTPKSLSSSPARPTPLPCQPSSPPGPPSPSSSPKPTPGNVPESPPRPTSNGYVNLQPEPGSGAGLCSCLVPLLAATTGPVLLRGLL